LLDDRVGAEDDVAPKCCAHLCALAFWVFVGLGFNFAVLTKHGSDAALEWFDGYLLEWLLSMDNLFVFHMIFAANSTPKKLLHKALAIGIVAAALARVFFFVSLGSMLHSMRWVRIPLGVLLIYSGIQAAREEQEENADDAAQNAPLRMSKHILGERQLDKYDSTGRLLVVQGDKWCATLLLPVVACLCFADIMFAMDSISAKVAQVPDFYLAYTSTVIAMLGLRAMFFIIKDIVDAFELLKYGLALILVFIGLQLVGGPRFEVTPQVSCIMFFAVFVVCIVGSVLRQRSLLQLSRQEHSFETRSGRGH